MHRIIGVTDFQRQFRDVFDEVSRKKVPYVLTRGSRPEAVLISYEQYCRFAEREEQELLESVDRLLDRLEAHNERYAEEEVAADVAAARRDRQR